MRACRGQTLAHRVAERGAVRRHVRDDHVVHVASVVHDEHHARLGRDARQRLVVRVSQADAVEETHAPAREVVADAEVEVGVEGGHDLAGVALHLANQHLARGAGRERLGFDRRRDLGVVGQAVDEDLSLRLVKCRHLELKPGVELGDDPIHLLAKEPAHTGDQQALHQRPERQGASDDRNPEGDRDAFRHPFLRSVRAAASKSATIAQIASRTPPGAWREVAWREGANRTPLPGMAGRAWWCGPLPKRGPSAAAPPGGRRIGDVRARLAPTGKSNRYPGARGACSFVPGQTMPPRSPISTLPQRIA